MITLPYKPEVQRITQADKIISLGCEYFKVTYEDLKSKCRERELTDKRHMIMMLIKDRTRETLKAIGKRFNRGHSVVSRTVVCVLNRCHTEEAYNETYTGLKDYVTDNLKAI